MKLTDVIAVAVRLSERFLKKTRREEFERKPGLGPCLVWTGALRNGYGHFAMPGGPVYAHRLAFVVEMKRDLRPGLDVRHRCDHRPCVEPSHLVEGTRLENVTDAVSQGRHSHGEKHGCAKITDAQVREIRALVDAGELYRAVAARFRVSTAYVSLIKHGKLRRSA